MENLPLAVTTYQLSLWIHITAAVVGLGMTFAGAVLFPVAMSQDPRHLPYVHRVQLTINRYVAGPALLLLLITGIYQVSKGHWDFGSFWISATFVLVLLIGGINGGYFIQTDKRLEAMISREVEAAGSGEFVPSEEYLRQARIEGIIGGVVGLMIVVIIYLMVAKPGM